MSATKTITGHAAQIWRALNGFRLTVRGTYVFSVMKTLQQVASVHATVHTLFCQKGIDRQTFEGRPSAAGGAGPIQVWYWRGPAAKPGS